MALAAGKSGSVGTGIILSQAELAPYFYWSWHPTATSLLPELAPLDSVILTFWKD